MIEKIGSYFEIVFALINRYRPVYVRDISKDKETGQKILQLADETNNVKEYIEKINDENGKQPKWTDLNISNSINNFWKMNFDELQELTLLS